MQTPILLRSWKAWDIRGTRNYIFGDVSWNGWPVGKLYNIIVTKNQKPSQNFVEGLYDTLWTWCKHFFDPLSPHTLHLGFNGHMNISARGRLREKDGL